MGRVFSTAFCVALLAAAAAAFALTEGAKTELSPVYGTVIDKVFSPICDPHICARREAIIFFKLRKRERLQVWVKSATTGKRVATLVAGRSYPKGPVRLAFRGLTPDGAVLPDGDYLPVVRLVGDLTLTLPNPILLDTVPPRIIHHPHGVSLLLAPGAVGEPQVVRIPYTLSAAGHGVLFADGHRVALTYRQRLTGVLAWYGTIGGGPAPAGSYTLELAVRDAAGNQSRPIAVGTVRVGYLTLAVTHLRVAPKAVFSVRVIIGPAHLTWVFAGRRGSAETRPLRLRAPRRKGSYELYVSGDGHAATVVVVVT